MHLPEIQIDTALALNVPKESGPKSLNAGTPDTSFQKLLEKTMNETRAADKARDDERSTRTKEAQNRQDKTGETRQTQAEDSARDAPNEVPRNRKSGEAEQPRKTNEKHERADENREESVERENQGREANAVNSEAKKNNANFDIHKSAGKTKVLPRTGESESALKAIEAQDDSDKTGVKLTAEEDALLAHIMEKAVAPSEPDSARETESLQNARREKDALFEMLHNTVEPEQTAAMLLTSELRAHENFSAPISEDAAEENATALAGAKKTGKKFFEGEKPLFTVIDERAPTARQEKNSMLHVSSEGNHAELSLSLSDAAKDARTQITPNAADKGIESRFASMLSDEIKSNAGEFVKTGSIILKDHDSGSIRLALNPKDLGDVKILLQLTDNNINARISVATKEAYDAFKTSIESLKQAFNDSGFSTGDFDLSWSGANAQGNRQNENGESPRYTQEFSAAQYVHALPEIDAESEKSFMDKGLYAVNIMA